MAHDMDDALDFITRQTVSAEGVPGAALMRDGKRVSNFGALMRTLFALRRLARRHKRSSVTGVQDSSRSGPETARLREEVAAVIRGSGGAMLDSPAIAGLVASVGLRGDGGGAMIPMAPGAGSSSRQAWMATARRISIERAGGGGGGGGGMPTLTLAAGGGGGGGGGGAAGGAGTSIVPRGVQSVEEAERSRVADAISRKQVIMAILFADVVGYSKLAEAQVLTFVERFLGAVGALMEAMPVNQQPKVRNSWGDAIYGVWTRVSDAGVFALMLSDLVTRVPWWRLGLPKGLNVRVSLHAAPVHPVIDPITLTKNYTGVHTSRAARIEPITPPGCVYCSQAFAAMSETLCVPEYECTYVGNVPLAKGYGLQPVYHVRWSSQQSTRQFRQALAPRVREFAPATRPSEETDDDDDRRVPVTGPVSK